MAFFDKIGDKAKGLVDSAKITYKVSEEKSKLSELFCQCPTYTYWCH